MKIAQIAPTFPPYPGGIGAVAYSLTLELRKIGHEVEVFTPKYRNNKNEIDKVKINRLKPLFKYGNAAFVPQIIWKLKKFDLVHLHYPFFGGAEIVYLWKIFNRKTPLVITYHMDVVGIGFLKYFFKFHTKFILPRIIKKADKIIVSSIDYLENSNIRKFYIKHPQKFIELPFGVENSFKPEARDKEVMEKYQIAENDLSLLFVGALDKAHYFKGLDNLIKAFADVKTRTNGIKSKLLVVGSGNRQSEYEILAETLKVSNDIHFLGSVSRELLPKLYNLSDIFVLPSIDKSEAFGLVIVEAMACAKPVIASRLPGVRQIINNKITGFLVEPNDVSDLALKLEQLIQSKQLRQNFGEQGRKKVERKYLWLQIAIKLEELYKSLIE